jgi:hypothetical protein
VGCRQAQAGYRLRATGYRLQAGEFRVQTQTRSPKPEARSPKPEARSPKPEARSPKPVKRATGYRLQASGSEPEARSPKPAARSPKPKAHRPTHAVSSLETPAMSVRAISRVRRISWSAVAPRTRGVFDVCETDVYPSAGFAGLCLVESTGARAGCGPPAPAARSGGAGDCVQERDRAVQSGSETSRRAASLSDRYAVRTFEDVRARLDSGQAVSAARGSARAALPEQYVVDRTRGRRAAQGRAFDRKCCGHPAGGQRGGVRRGR